ncbi:hypothetical protein [Pseudomonas sp. RIT623]|uniref:hypothetical protein n=1 Tax=Pseudomonas sp. RIT623 TaxID=2559075 RepID=UPI00106FC401|nr:hypothetical protein [Pseudomonas sp. RIT623]TFF33872.1 hypothetical protein E3U47_24480 [Pseudomonas sp. RIT623]
MKTFKLDDMTRGWFVGAFNPTSFATEACEVGLKRYTAGDYEASHYHKVATEITLIVEGRVLMNGIEYSSGDIIIIEPGDMTDFRALTDTVNVVVKTPGALHDKYIP